jgi:xanthine dehydrogenase/oxidase
VTLAPRGACAGNSVDLSHAVLDRAVLHSDGTYAIPNLRIYGRMCRTNQASNTAYRGFGGPQGMLIANMWMDHLARELGIPSDVIQERNMYKADGTTHFKQKCEPERLRACWDGALEQAGWQERRAAVDALNRSSRCVRQCLHQLTRCLAQDVKPCHLSQAMLG